MCAIPQLVSAPLNPIPIAEHFRRSHPQCEYNESLSWECVKSKLPIYPLSKCDEFTLHSTLILHVSIGSRQHILKYMIY